LNLEDGTDDLFGAGIGGDAASRGSRSVARDEGEELISQRPTFEGQSNTGRPPRLLAKGELLIHKTGSDILVNTLCLRMLASQSSYRELIFTRQTTPQWDELIGLDIQN
jgi:hypothetical protein